MSSIQAPAAGVRRRGNEADYAFGTRDGWRAFQVIRFHGVEELSKPFRFTIDLARDAAAGPVDLDELVDSDASLYIASAAAPRLVHGVIATAEETERTRTLIVYRVELEPHFARLQHRKGCRTFRQRSFKEVIAMLLENRVLGRAGGADAILPFVGELAPPSSIDLTTFAPAEPSYRFVLTEAESARFDDPEYRASIVQFNESDLALASRLLEAEGLSYFLECTERAAVLTITDDPGGVGLCGATSSAPLRSAAQGSRADDLEFVRAYRQRRTVRSRATRVRHFNGDLPFKQLESAAEAIAGAGGRSENFEFPSPGGGLADDKNTPLFSRIQLERHEAERAMSSGASSVRALAPGARLAIRDEEGGREDADVLVVSVETYAAELDIAGLENEHEPFGFPGERRVHGPAHENRFRALPAATRFRPDRATPRPRIHGVHRAVVTSEEHDGKQEINTNRDGDVRLRFAWDDRPAESGVATSNWVPVTNPWAGTNFGSMHVPRVGQSVFASFDNGDPDQPVVTGGYYSTQTPAPYDPTSDPNMTGIRSQSTPDATGSNELYFDDSAGSEMFNLTAQKDMDIEISNDLELTVGNDASVDITGVLDVDVQGDISVGGQGALVVEILGQVTETFDQNYDLNVEGDRKAVIEGSCEESVDSKWIGAKKDFEVEARNVLMTAVEGAMTLHSKAALTAWSKTDATLNGSDCAYVIGKEVKLLGDSLVKIVAGDIEILGDAKIRLVVGGSSIELTPGGIKISSSGPVSINGAPLKLNC